jgi:hypothetical protein
MRLPRAKWVVVVYQGYATTSFRMGKLHEQGVADSQNFIRPMRTKFWPRRKGARCHRRQKFQRRACWCPPPCHREEGEARTEKTVRQSSPANWEQRQTPTAIQSVDCVNGLWAWSTVAEQSGV